jgi:hypothetical protein
MAIEWGAESLRLSLFASGQVRVTDEDWRSITGQDEAASRQALPGGRVLAGPFDVGQLSLAGIGNRIDVILTLLPAPDQSAGGRLPTIGPWEAAAGRFVEFASAWVSGLTASIIRVAFGAVLLCETESRDAANSLLAQLLPSVKIDSENTKELLYRINRPVLSRVIPSLILNRITTWSSIQITPIVMQFGTSGATRVLGNEHYMVRLEVDHNTDANSQDRIGSDRLKSVFQELVLLASENAARGEQP